MIFFIFQNVVLVCLYLYSTLISLTVIINPIPTKCSYVLFWEKKFWFYTRTSISRIFSPDCWFIYRLWNLSEWGIIHIIYFSRINNITALCDFQREPFWKHVSNGSIIILPCKRLSILLCHKTMCPLRLYIYSGVIVTGTKSTAWCANGWRRGNVAASFFQDRE